MHNDDLMRIIKKEEVVHSISHHDPYIERMNFAKLREYKLLHPAV